MLFPLLSKKHVLHTEAASIHSLLSYCWGSGTLHIKRHLGAAKHPPLQSFYNLVFTSSLLPLHFPPPIFSNLHSSLLINTPPSFFFFFFDPLELRGFLHLLILQCALIFIWVTVRYFSHFCLACISQLVFPNFLFLFFTHFSLHLSLFPSSFLSCVSSLALSRSLSSLWSASLPFSLPLSLPRCQVVTHWRCAAKDLACAQTHMHRDQPRVPHAGHMLHVLRAHAHTKGTAEGQGYERRVRDTQSHRRDALSAKWKAANSVESHHWSRNIKRRHQHTHSVYFDTQ